MLIEMWEERGERENMSLPFMLFIYVLYWAIKN